MYPYTCQLDVFYMSSSQSQIMTASRQLFEMKFTELANKAAQMGVPVKVKLTRMDDPRYNLTFMNNAWVEHMGEE